MQGNIPLENLDDRSWQDLVDQAKALAQQYAPQWTDLGPSDLGVTLIELFAWLVEGMQYRLNRVPDRTYAAMLNLVGVTLDPARPAVAMLTFTPQVPLPPPGTPPTVPAGTVVSTTATEAQPPIAFETDADLTVLPANLAFAFTPAGTTVTELTSNLVKAPLSGWVLSVASKTSVQLLFGFDAALAGAFQLNVRIGSRPPLPSAVTKWPTTAWTYSVAGGSPLSAPPTGTAVVDNTNNLQQSGVVQFPALTGWVPRTLKEVLTNVVNFGANDPLASRSACWLCLTVTAPDPPPGVVTFTYSVSLAHMLFNSVSATHLITVKPDNPEELDPPSNGQPWQEYQLKHAPLYKTPGVSVSDQYGHVHVTADEPGVAAPQEYKVVDDFPRAPDKTRCCRLDPVTATILFGSNDGTDQSTGTGLIPPKGSKLKAIYRAVAGGAEGNVPPNTLLLFAPPTGVQSVTNPGAGRGGADQELVADAKRRAPDLLRIRSRAVTVDDYTHLALEASTLVSKAAALGPDANLDGSGNFSRAPGTVTVLVVPEAPVADPHPDSPEDLIKEVRTYLDARRVVTTALTISSPRYMPVSVSATVFLFPRALADVNIKTTLQTNLSAAATAYLHPLFGGPDGTGWDIGQSLFVAGLFAPLQAVIGAAGYIAKLTVGFDTPRPGSDYQPKDVDPSVGLVLLDFELLCGGSKHAFQFQP
jgi:predicted phage baseplate assembly protein